ncbi:MAG: hypothetical protein OXC81_01005 [Betaproteobacteria bacterium]|nr:hypothetical protein [Betaproteobacteria bacterium]
MFAYAQDVGNCILLTADKKLRNEAEKMSVNVHGTLWLLDKLLATSSVSPARLQRVLLVLKSDLEVFLPAAAIDALLDKCRKS